MGRKKYSLKELARLYVIGYNRFTLEHEGITDVSESYNLFVYSIKKVYGLEAVEYNDYIAMYGDECITYLSSLPNTPKKKDSIFLLDRCSLVDLCSFYFVLFCTL